MTQPKSNSANTPRKFAQDTTVTQERTLAEIRTLLRKYHADGFIAGDEPGRAVIGCRHAGRVYRFDLPMPDVEAYRKTPTGIRRTDQAMVKAWQDECNRRFRALLATIKGRVIAIDEAISTFEQEFALEFVLPNNQTVRQHIVPQIMDPERADLMPPLLPG